MDHLAAKVQNLDFLRKQAQAAFDPDATNQGVITHGLPK